MTDIYEDVYDEHGKRIGTAEVRSYFVKLLVTYHLFSFDYHKSYGGISDYQGGFGTLKEAKEKADLLDEDFHHIIIQREGDDTRPATLVVVSRGSRQMGTDNKIIVRWSDMSNEVSTRQEMILGNR